MKVHAINPILNVSDVPGTIRWFHKLGWCTGFAWNSGGMIQGDAMENEHGPAVFGSVCANTAEEGEGPSIFLCKDGQGSRDPHTKPDPDNENYGGVWMSWWVSDVNAAHAECVRNGIEIIRQPVNEPWNVREFLIRHPDGHYFRISGKVQ